MPKIFGFYQIKKGGRALLAGLVVMLLLGGSAVYVNATAKLKPVYQAEDLTEKVVALTFDISWGNTTPLPVIDILKEQGVQCTMFLSGPWVKQYPEIPQRLVTDGHEIASHGYRHINLSELSAADIQAEVRKAHDNIKEVTGAEPRLIRTPNGDYNDTVIQAIHDMDYEAIQWSVDSLDWMNPGVDTIIERVTQKVHPGAIILMHASDTCKQTTDALPAILQNLKEQGYRFVTVSELLALQAAAEKRDDDAGKTDDAGQTDDAAKTDDADQPDDAADPAAPPESDKTTGPSPDMV